MKTKSLGGIEFFSFLRYYYGAWTRRRCLYRGADLFWSVERERATLYLFFSSFFIPLPQLLLAEIRHCGNASPEMRSSGRLDTRRPSRRGAYWCRYQHRCGYSGLSVTIALAFLEIYELSITPSSLVIPLSYPSPLLMMPFDIIPRVKISKNFEAWKLSTRMINTLSWNNAKIVFFFFLQKKQKHNVHF